MWAMPGHEGFSVVIYPALSRDQTHRTEAVTTPRVGTAGRHRAGFPALLRDIVERRRGSLPRRRACLAQAAAGLAAAAPAPDPVPEPTASAMGPAAAGTGRCRGRSPAGPPRRAAPWSCSTGP